MKLERLSDNKIRCILNRADLQEKQIMLSELAYGSDKAKELFAEMMEKAYDELGFEVDNDPLMIEAIPVSKDCLILIITKVEDPEELDTRFSSFTNPPINGEDFEDNEDGVMNILPEELGSHLRSLIGDALDAIASLAENPDSKKFLPFGDTPDKSDSKKKKAEAEPEDSGNFTIYCFKDLDEIIKAAILSRRMYNGGSRLFKHPDEKKYYLVLDYKEKNDKLASVISIMAEYGERIKAAYATPYYFKEHYITMIKKDAIETLATL